MTELAVLVPVLNRPANVAPLVESFRRNCPSDAELWFLVNVDDTAEIDAIADSRARLPVARGAPHRIVMWQLPKDIMTWPQKINAGVTQSADWYLLGADDITFTPGWWDATKELRDDPSIGVIGTADSLDGNGNPRVAAGTHTCHPLMRADYIRTAGTIDVPGLAVHGAYHHWCVDDELVWTAKLREAWAFCPDAIVQHNHPYWGLADMDDTYRAGEAHAAEDMALWRERAKLLGLEVVG